MADANVVENKSSVTGGVYPTHVIPVGDFSGRASGSQYGRSNVTPGKGSTRSVGTYRRLVPADFVFPSDTLYPNKFIEVP